MWKNWNIFRRRAEENTDLSINGNDGSGGKENIGEIGRRGLADRSEAETSSGLNNGRTSNGDLSFNNDSRQATNCSVEENRYNSNQFSQDDDSVCGSSTDQLTPRRRGEQGMSNPAQDVATPRTRSTTSSPFTRNRETPHLSRGSNSRSKYENGNQSFSGVYGPLLSTPIVPKVRRALESSGGLRSPQTSGLVRGKQVGRSSSLNYGSGNPTKSTAGHVPWVRLKKRESLTLSDILSGNTPQSPNTVKLAAPEPRLLPCAPSFKTTPVIVTTEYSRDRMVDTQTVVSALREKRKRFGVSQREDSFNEDSWITAAKRRRQDSSQSNASSVSIPSMAESLPNLMGTPGVSLRHIESIKDQRPSTVPAMDAFVSRHQREFGLGGDMLGHKPYQPVLNYQQQQIDEREAKHRQAGKSVLRSIQSSLSSSLRARTNLSILQQSGIDLNRIRQLPDGHDHSRTRNMNSGVTSLDHSVDEPQSKVSRLTSADTIILPTTPSLTDKALPTCSSEKRPGTVSSQTKQKIADGVVLRKNSLSVSFNNGSPRPNKMVSLNTHVSTIDFEQDRQKEYKRRVLDLLDEDEASERADVVRSTATTTPITLMTSSVPAPTVSTNLPTSMGASLAATSAAVSANLDSLNKLVQFTTAAMPSSTSAGSTTGVTSASTLTQLLNSVNEKPSSTEQALKGAESLASSLAFSATPSVSSISTSLATNKDVSFGSFITSMSSSQNPGTEQSTASSVSSAATGGFTLGTAQATAQTMSLPTAGGFSLNFSSPASSTLTSTATSSTGPTSFVASTVTGSNQPASNTGFNFSSGSVQSSAPNSSFIGSLTTGASLLMGLNSASTKAPDYGAKVLDLSSSTSEYLDNSFKISTPSFPPSGKPGQPQVSSNMLSHGTTQGLLSSSGGSFSLLSTLQAFSNPSQSDVTREGMNPSQNLASSVSASTSTPFATGTTAAAGMFNFGASNNIPSLNSGFSFGTTGGATTPANNLATVSAPSTVGNSTNLGFNFGAINPASTTAAGGQLGGLAFGMASTNSLGVTAAPAGWATTTASLSATGFTGQSTNQVVTGFGSSSQATPGKGTQPAAGQQPQNMFTTAQSMFQSVGSPFATSSQAPVSTQQSFAPTTTPTAFSSFGATTTASNNFSLGQNSSGNVMAKPFTFGAASTQPAATNSFGGAVGGAPVSTSISALGNMTNIPQATSAFGNDLSSMFGSGTVNSQFGAAAVPTTSPPAFGSVVSTFGAVSQASSVFGAAAVPTTSPPAFGSAVSTFGAISQAPSVFGAAGGQSMFGAPVSSANQLFTFGSSAAGAAQSNPQPASTFASNPATAFGSNAATPSTTFGSNPSANFGSNPTTGLGSNITTAFGSNPATGFGSNPAAAFGSNPATAFGSNPATAFGSNPATGSGSNPGTAFGSNQATQSTTFGSNPATAFGSNPATAFGSNPGTAFGSNPTAGLGSNSASSFGGISTAAGSSLFGAKPATPAFGAATTNPPPAFGAQTQSASTAVSPPSHFGSSFGTSNTFGAQPNQQKSAFGTTAASFGAPATPAFGATPQNSVFGAATQNPQQNAFGAATQNPQQNAFGAATQNPQQNAFGAATQNPQQNAFGAAMQNPQQNAFGAATQNPQQNAFGAGTQNPQQNAFGATQQTQATAFGLQQGSVQTANSFGAANSGGGSFFAAAKPNTFGAATTTQASFNFAGAQPSSFNGSQTAAAAFNFGQAASQPAAGTNMGMAFGAQAPTPRPPFQSPANGFNFAAAAGATPTFNFSGAPSAPKPFNPETPTSIPRPRASVRRPARRGGARR